MIPIKSRCIFVTKVDQVEQEFKEKLDCSASNKLDRPTSEMAGKHQPSAFSTKIFVSKSMITRDSQLATAVLGAVPP